MIQINFVSSSEPWTGSGSALLCGGKRLNEQALAVKIEDRSIIDVTDLNIYSIILLLLGLKIQHNLFLRL